MNLHPDVERLIGQRSLPTNVAERPAVINVNSLRTKGLALTYSSESLVGNWVEQRVYEDETEQARLKGQNNGSWKTMYCSDFQTTRPSTFDYKSTLKLVDHEEDEQEIQEHYATTNAAYGASLRLPGDTVRFS